MFTRCSQYIQLSVSYLSPSTLIITYLRASLRLLTICFILVGSAMFGAPLMWLHVSDYHNFWKTERQQSADYQFIINNQFGLKAVLQNGVNVLSYVFFLFLFLFFCFVLFCFVYSIYYVYTIYMAKFLTWPRWCNGCASPPNKKSKSS